MLDEDISEENAAQRGLRIAERVREAWMALHRVEKSVSSGLAALTSIVIICNLV